MSPPIHPLTSSQGAVFLINSCQAYFRCGHTCLAAVRQALFRSYGHFFAEFLGDLSFVRLRLLDVITCVGLRYGSFLFMLREFSWKRALSHSFPPKRKSFRCAWSSCLAARCVRIFLNTHLTPRTSNPIMCETYCTPSSQSQQ